MAENRAFHATRILLGLSQESLAEQAGVSAATISNLESDAGVVGNHLKDQVRHSLQTKGAHITINSVSVVVMLVKAFQDSEALPSLPAGSGKTLDEEHEEVARSFGREFSRKEFIARYREFFPGRPIGSILVQDYAKGENPSVAAKPKFLKRLHRAHYIWDAE